MDAAPPALSLLFATYLFAAPDQPGLVARLAGFFYDRGLNILDARNHTDAHAEGGPRFSMRIVADLASLAASRGDMERAFRELAGELSGSCSIRYSDVPAKVCILVTKDGACLYDLLLRHQAGELPCEIPLVIGNHPTLEQAASGFGIPFVVLPVTKETKADQEARVLELLQGHQIDLVVLARYMQILSEGFLAAAPPVINIHHGFLPAFQGARPYHQAHARGVKLIGATAHYATKDLDQGPIIEQDVARVTHEMGPFEMARIGRDVERVVLARAVRAHLEHRVLVEGRKTVVL